MASTRMLTLACAVAVALCAATTDAKTVAIADVGARSEKSLDVFEEMVKAAGHEVRRITGPSRTLENESAYEGADVVILTGGWNDSRFPSVAACRQLVRFAARGGGVLLGGFRGGAVRTGGFAAFPDVAQVVNRCNSPWLRRVGTSPLAAALGESPVLFGGYDHMVVRPGRSGTVFARCGDDSVGAFGPCGLGRVVVFGVFLSVPQDNPGVDRNKAVYRAVIDYLTGAPTADAAAREEAARAALDVFDRRMFVHEWTHDERGEGMGRGTIIGIRDELVIAREGRAMLLEFFAKNLVDKPLAAKCGELAPKLRAVASAVRSLADEKIAAVKEYAAGPRFGQGESPFDAAALTNAFAAVGGDVSFDAADALVRDCRTAMRAQRKAALAAEHAENLKSLPSLVVQLASPDEEFRLSAATELGRIGEATADVVSALVKALDDSADKVRVQAAISLGWMQAKDAVPALIAKARQNDDGPLKRRAVQALGQIGDDRAVPAVLEALDSVDRYTFENAILSLGYLKAKEAVPRLIAIASDESEPLFLADKKSLRDVDQNMPVVNRRASAVLALGYIGDAAAVPALEEIVRKNRSFWSDTKAITAYLGASLNLIASDALAQIAAGGRVEKGVRQPEALASKAAFYSIRRRNHALVGRIDGALKCIPGFQDGNEPLLLPYLADAGFTGIQGAWGEFDFKTDEVLEEAIRDMEDLGLVFVGILPGRRFGDMGDLARASQERAFARIGDSAAYVGVWSEENLPVCPSMNRWKDPEATADVRKRESPDPMVCKIDTVARATRVACLEEAGAELEARWRETQDWLHARRKGFAFTFSQSAGELVNPIDGQSALARLDCTGPESYESFGRFIAYACERFRNGEAKSMMAEFYNMYAASNENVLRGCWLSAVHSKCYFPFAINQFAPFFSSYNSWSWDKGRWPLYAEVFRHVRAHEDVYAVSPSATEVAVLLSERSFASFKHKQRYAMSQVPENIDQTGLSIWTALGQSHVYADVVFIDNATERKLAKYKVLFLGAAKVLTEREQTLLRKWVADGCTLVCEGTVSLFDAKNLARRGNYAIADVLGVRYLRTDFTPTKEVFSQRAGGLNGKWLIPVGQGLDNFYRFEEYVWREEKPTDCVVAAKDASLGPVEYDASLGVDRVELAGAKAIQTFPDGSPALTENAYGKGRAFLFTPVCPSYGHLEYRWEMDPCMFDFWPGVRETYEKLAREGLARAGSEPAVDLLGASKDVEITVYSQDDGRRLVVHLLDYDVNNREVAGASLRVNGTRPIKSVGHPDGAALARDGRMVRLDTFHAYDVVIVDFE